MKKFISVFLVMSMIMCNLNTGVVDALSNCCNEVKSFVNEVINDEDKNDVVTNDEVKNDNLQVDTKVEKETPQVTTNDDSEKSEVVTSKNKDKQSENSLEKKESVYSSNENITVIDSKKNNFEFTKLDKAMTYIKNSLSSDNIVTVVFNKNYSLDEYDVESMRCQYDNKRLIFTSNPQATVTIDSDLELYNQYYQPGYDSANVITFQNIKLKFTKQTTIYANGTWLHMGEGVTMVGDYKPNLCASSPHQNSKQINSTVRMFIQSGDYNQIYMTPKDGRRIENEGWIYFFGGHANEIVRFNGYTYNGIIMHVGLYGGIVDKVKNEHEDSATYSIYINVLNTATVGSLENVDAVEIGTVIDTDQGEKTGHLIVNKDAKNIHVLMASDGSIIEVGKDGKLTAKAFINFGGSTTVRVPANRDNDVPVELELIPGMNSKPVFKVELSTEEDAVEEFYAIHIKDPLRYVNKDTFIIHDNENFYFNKIANENDEYYLKGKLKEKGPLIYDATENKFFYETLDHKEKEASWINDKKLDFNRELTYDNLAKDNKENQYILSSHEITIRIRGTASNRTLKFNNDRYRDRPISIEFDKLNLSDSELLFKNIKSITVKGDNSIIRSSSNTKIPLTYSFAGNNADALSLKDENSSFVVYDQDNRDKYTIRDNIVNNTNNTNKGNTCIVNMSFEQDIASKINYKLVDVNSGSIKRFFTKNGYSKLTLLLPGDDKDYLLKEDSSSKSEIPCYYQSTNINNDSNQNCGIIGNKFTLNRNSKKNYYKVDNEARVYVIAYNNKNKNNYYYISNNVRNAITRDVSSTDITHNVIFLGNYTITPDDVDAIKNHDKNTAGVIYKTKIDDWKYLLNVGENIELKPDTNSNQFPITFNNIKFKFNTDDKWIYASGRQLTFGDDVEMEGPFYPSISAGTSSKRINSSIVTINSGTYKCVTGDCYNTLKNAKITINNGTFKGEVSGTAINDVTLAINNGTFDSKVYGVRPECTVNGSLNMTINDGVFKQEVIGVGGTVINDATLTINNGTFDSKVRGSGMRSTVNRSLSTIINNGVFKQEVIGVGGTVRNNASLIINNGDFKSFLLGISSDNTKSKFTLKSLFNGDLFRNSTRATVNTNLNMTINNGTFRNEIHGAQSSSNIVTVNLNILGGDFENKVVGTQVEDSNLIMTVNGGTFKSEFVGQYSTSATDKADSVILNIAGGIFENVVTGSSYANRTVINLSGGTFNSNSHLIGSKTGSYDSIINVDGNINIPTIAYYDELIIGESNSNSILTITDKLDIKGNRSHNLTIKNGSELQLTGSNQSMVNKLTIDGTGNILTLNIDSDKAPLLVKSSYNNNGVKLKLNLTGNKANDKNIIDFERHSVNVDKFDFTDNEYYIRKIDNSNNNGSMIKLYSRVSPKKLIFKLDLSSPSLTYSIDNGHLFENVWWCEPDLLSQEISFTKDSLLNSDNIMPFKDISKIPEKVFELTGLGFNKTISFNLGNELNFDFKLDNCQLDSSRLDVKNIRRLRLSGDNSILGNNSENRAVFSYTFNNSKTDDNIVFDTDNSYLKISTDNENIKPFDGVQEDRIDLKFLKPFDEDTSLILKKSSREERFDFDIPNGTQRLGLLINNKDKVEYNLYDATSDDAAGSSAYVSGDTEKTFKESFTTSSNNETVYEFVRIAKPVNIINLEIPKNQINFSVNLSIPKGQQTITDGGFTQSFNSTDVEIKNNSIVAKDTFMYNGETKYLGRQNTDLELESIKVSRLTDIDNGLQLVSKKQLGSSIINSTPGTKVALKFSDEENNTIPIDETKNVTTPLRTFIIPSQLTKKLKLVPDFDDNKHFFNTSANLDDILNSSHTCTFRFKVKN